MSYRVIQWATGGVGRAAMEGVLAHPDLELAGAWVHSPAKEGVDLGELLGRDPLGVTATGDVDALLATAGRLRPLQPDLRRPGGGGRHPRVGQERGHAARLVLPAARGAREVRRHRQGRRGDPARHRASTREASPSGSRS